MKHWLLAALLLLGIAGCATGPVDQNSRVAPPATAMSAATHLVVTIDLGTPERDTAIANDLARRYEAELVAQWPLATLDARCLVLRVPPQRLETVLESLTQERRVTRVQKVVEHSVMTRPNRRSMAALQTNLADMNAAAAHRHATGRGVRIAVIDTGLDAEHPDLAGRIETVRNFVDDRTDGRQERHGTAIAGLISASGGLRGIAFDAQLVSLRGCWQEIAGSRGACNTLSLARAINFAAANSVDIINMSIAGPEDPLLADLIDAAVERGSIVIAAAGPPETDAFPASHDRVIAARSPGDHRDERGIPAPARDVLSTAPGGNYDFFSGSSVASAQVAGVAALLREAKPEATVDEIRAVLAAASQPRSARQSGNAVAVLDACQAVSLALKQPC
ncbi:MAG: S8 family serine peptidase [Pseudomonadota bacterium]